MSTAYTAARERAACLDRVFGRIVLTGADRASYLHGLLTNDIATLTAGTGCYAAYLTAQGRMIADLYLYELGDAMLMTVHRDVKDTVLARLDQFIFGEDVQLGDVTATYAQVGVVGPEAAAVVSGVADAGVELLRSLPEHGNARTSFAGHAAIVTRTSDAGTPGFDLFVPAEQRDALVGALRSANVPELSAVEAETLRIEGGVPLFHRDMDEETIPLEAGIESRAISFTKGCYVGQEVIVRVLHRGHGRVARRLVGLRIEGREVPQTNAAIRGGDKDVGHVTSAAFSPQLDQPIALGYVHRDFVEPGTPVNVGGRSAIVAALPFVPQP